MSHIVTHPIPVIRYEGHPISSDNDHIKTKPISPGRVSVILICYLEYRELNHLFKYFPCCNRNGCLATKEQTVKGHGRDTICGIHAKISKTLRTPL